MSLHLWALFLSMFVAQHAVSGFVMTASRATPANSPSVGLNARASSLQMLPTAAKEAPWKKLNEMNKMSVMKKEAPKVRPQKLPTDMLDVTTKFKKVYERRELETLWGAVMAIYGTQERAKQAVLENPQVWPRSGCVRRETLLKAATPTAHLAPSPPLRRFSTRATRFVTQCSHRVRAAGLEPAPPSLNPASCPMDARCSLDAVG
jgi:hypothetical protein